MNHRRRISRSRIILSLESRCFLSASSCASNVLIRSPKLPSAVKTPIPASITRRHVHFFSLHNDHCENVMQVPICTGTSSLSGLGLLMETPNNRSSQCAEKFEKPQREFVSHASLQGSNPSIDTIEHIHSNSRSHLNIFNKKCLLRSAFIAASSSPIMQFGSRDPKLFAAT